MNPVSVLTTSGRTGAPACRNVGKPRLFASVVDSSGESHLDMLQKIGLTALVVGAALIGGYSVTTFAWAAAQFILELPWRDPVWLRWTVNIVGLGILAIVWFWLCVLVLSLPAMAIAGIFKSD